MKYEIRSIGLWSFVKQSFFINLALGFLVGVLYAIMLGAMLSFSSRFPLFESTQEDLSKASFGLLMVIVPIVTAFMACLFNTIVGVIAIMIYNGMARLIGGLELELSPVADEQPAPVMARPVMAAGADMISPPPPPPLPRQMTPPPPPRPENDQSSRPDESPLA